MQAVVVIVDGKKARHVVIVDKVTRSSFQVKLVPSAVITESMSLKFAFEPKTLRIAVLSGKSRSEMPLLSRIYRSRIERVRRVS